MLNAVVTIISRESQRGCLFANILAPREVCRRRGEYYISFVGTPSEQYSLIRYRLRQGSISSRLVAVVRVRGDLSITLERDLYMRLKLFKLCERFKGNCLNGGSVAV